MTLPIRCHLCGTLNVLTRSEDHRFTCRMCHGALEIPTAIADMPRPHVSGQDKPIRVQALDADVEEDLHARAAYAVVSRALPWLSSLLLHAALAVILMTLIAFVAMDPPENLPPVRIVDGGGWGNDGGSLVDKHAPTPDREAPRSFTRSTHPQPILERDILVPFGGRTSRKFVAQPDSVDVTGDDTGGLFDNTLGPPKRPGPRQIDETPDPNPPGRAATHVVFLIDRSGSMVDTFGQVQFEIVRSVAMMTEAQKFQVILFSDGRPLSNSRSGMVRATRRNKRALAGFLSTVKASGQTDPVPALDRAFASLKAAVGARRDRLLVHLLTDGVFPDNPAVLDTIRRLDPAGRVRINTYLFGQRLPTAEAAMKSIARMSGGDYKYVSPLE